MDDVDFHKIELWGYAAFMFAGKGDRIEEWKTWIRSDPTSSANRPDTKDIAVCMVNMEEPAILFQHGMDISKEDGLFAGSGARFAVECWSTNKDAQRAVRSAMVADPCSGGEVRFVTFSPRKHNLGGIHPTTANLAAVNNAIMLRGNVVYTSQQTPGQPPFKLSELAANDASLQELQSKIASGHVVPEAPCDGMHVEWTAEETGQLDVQLAKLFGWK
ncbi:MAG: hypothetical protein AB9M53_00510 [Leptothrix sp. (in: b-proteobacteria)]